MALTMIEVERIGNPRLGFQPCGVWRVGGFSQTGLIQEKLTPHLDYSRANSVGSRGIFEYYFLKPNNIYHVRSPRNFKKSDDDFCQVIDGKIVYADNFQQVMEWLRDYLASLSYARRRTE